MNNLIQVETRNKNIINNIWKVFYSIRESLKTKGITIGDNINLFSFAIYFDLNKINKNSKAYEHKIDGMSFSIMGKQISPDIFFLKDDKIFYIEGNFNLSIQINGLFCCRGFLKEIFEFIGVEIYMEDYEYMKKITEKDIENFNTILKEFKEDETNDHDIFKYNFEKLKYYKTEIDRRIECKKTFINKFENMKKNFNNIEDLKSIKEINYEVKKLENMNVLDEENLIIDLINFEKTLFSEIFNFISENTTLDERTKYLKNNFIIIADDINDFFKGRLKNYLSRAIDEFIREKTKCI